MKLVNINKKYKITPYVLVLKKKSVFAIYHTLKMDIIYLNKEGYELFNMFNEFSSPKKILNRVNNEYDKKNYLNIINTFIKYNFLISEDKYESSIFSTITKIKDAYPKIPVIKILYIITTLECNFACKYCFIERNKPIKEKKLKTKMSEEIVKKGIDLFIYNIQRTRSINAYNNRVIIMFYGGEPLLNFDIVKYAMEYLYFKKRDGAFEGFKPEFHMLTNGSLITNEIINFLKKFKINLGVSIDGSRRDNDKMRIYRNGYGTFNDVVKKLHLIKMAKLPLNISFTVGKHNIKNLCDNVKYLVDNFNPQSISFNLLVSLWEKDNIDNIDINYATKKILKCHDYLEREGIYEDRIGRRLNPFLKKKFYYTDCGAIGSQIVLSPTGMIYPCAAYLGTNKYSIPLTNSNMDLSKNKLWQMWNTRLPIKMDKCTNCKYISICGGGCAYNAEMKEGSLFSLDKQICNHVKLVLEYFIWRMYETLSKNENK